MDWRDKPIFEAGPLEGPSVYNDELMICDEYSGQNSMLDGGEWVKASSTGAERDSEKRERSKYRYGRRPQ